LLASDDPAAIVSAPIIGQSIIGSMDYLTIDYRDTKTNCRLYWCLILEFIDCRFKIQIVMLVFSTSPSNLLSGSPSPFPKLKYFTVYSDSVWLGGGGGVEFSWRPYSAGV
jgi:hypothetical protein